MPIIEVEGVTKLFRANRGGRALLGRGGLRTLLRKQPEEKVAALRDVSFTVAEGESLGIIGANGSGKSTLLKIIAGVTVPTEGTVKVYGRVASLLELGAGFHPMLSGRENIYLNAGILGMRHRQVDEVIDDIIAFSGVGDAIDYPVDTYSSGMYVRVAFAVAAHANPDVFLIDEVLSVGDEAFQRQCRQRIGELMEQGKTIVFVSHDLGIVNTLCERVILLSGGKMIVRDSAKNAIDFYLRQVGSEQSVHTMVKDDVEAIVCDGRVSLFHKEQELTGAAGFQLRIQNFGQWHSSEKAEWEIVERSEEGCVARGRMARLPVILVWRFSLDDEGLEWKIGFECEREIQFDSFEVGLYFSSNFVRWGYDDERGTFPEIQPEDTGDILITAPELLCERATVSADAESGLPTLVLGVEGHRSHLTGHWANTGYLLGCRVLRLEEHHMAQSDPLEKGFHEVLTLRCTLAEGGDGAGVELGDGARRYALQVGELRARFDRGRVRLSYGEQQISWNLHVYSSILMGNLWADSTSMRWEGFFEQEADTLRFEGRSRRFPYGIVWEISPVASGIALRIWLKAEEPLSIQEYQTSVALVAEYDTWETEHESGSFPNFESDYGDWKHANKDYAPGKFIRATGAGLPKVSLEADAKDGLPRMTAINTTIQQNARVLQALYTPEHGAHEFEAGKHLLFSGRVTVTPDDGS